MESLEYLTLKLVVDDGSRISVRVWEPAMRGAMSYRPRRAAGRMKPAVDLLRSHPALGDDRRPVVRRLRLANVALALAPVLGALVCIAVAKA